MTDIAGNELGELLVDSSNRDIVIAGRQIWFACYWIEIAIVDTDQFKAMWSFFDV